MEQRQCLKCGHLNEAANGGYLEACPSCGAIYTKVERALRERRAAEAAKAAQEEAERAAAAAKAARTAAKPAPAGAASAPAASPSAEAPEKSKASGWNTLGTIAIFVVLANVFWPGKSGSSRTAAPATPVAKVSNSGWDGSVYQVESYLKRNLKDPSSYEAIEWSKVISRPEGGFMVRVKYRAKNSFGGFVIEEKIFTLDAEGNVTGAAAI